MEQNKRKKVMTMILVCLVFIAINYAIYLFLLTPKFATLEEEKLSYQRGGENQSIFDALTIDKTNLEAEIEGMTEVEAAFRALVMNDFDTIQASYDFYTFSQVEEIMGVNAIYNLSELLEYRESYKEYLESKALADLEAVNAPNLDEAGNPYIVEIVELKADKTFLQIPIELGYEMEKNQLSEVLQQLKGLSAYKLFVNGLSIEVDNKQLETDNEASIDYIKLTLNYNVYLDSNLEDKVLSRDYQFYERASSFDQLEDMFATNVLEEVYIDVAETEILQDEPTKEPEQ